MVRCLGAHNVEKPLHFDPEHLAVRREKMKRSREHISESEDEGLDYDETEGDLSQLKVKDELDARAKNQLKVEHSQKLINFNF